MSEECDCPVCTLSEGLSTYVYTVAELVEKTQGDEAAHNLVCDLVIDLLASTMRGWPLDARTEFIGLIALDVEDEIKERIDDERKALH